MHNYIVHTCTCTCQHVHVDHLHVYTCIPVLQDLQPLPLFHCSTVACARREDTFMHTYTCVHVCVTHVCVCVINDLVSLNSSLRCGENITNPFPGYAEAATRGHHPTTHLLLLFLTPSPSPPILSTRHTAHPHTRGTHLHCSLQSNSSLIRTRFTEHCDFCI